MSAVALASMVLFVHYTGDYKTAYNNIGASVFVYSLGVFLAISNININFKEKNDSNLSETFKTYIWCLYYSRNGVIRV